MVDENPPSPQEESTSPDGLPSRLLGIIFSPAETFRGVVRRPVWLGMLLLVSIVSALFFGGFLTTEVGREAWMDAALEASSQEVSDAQIEALERIQPYAGYLGAGQALLGAPLVGLALSGALFLVFSIMGGTAAFRQIFAVVVHSNVIGLVQNVFIWPLNYFRQSLQSPTSLAALLPMLEEGGFGYHFATVIDLFLVWWLVVLSIGLGVLYKRKTTHIAVSLFFVYALIASIIALVRSS